MIDRFEKFLESLEGCNVSVNLCSKGNPIAEEMVFEDTAIRVYDEEYIIQDIITLHIIQDDITNITGNELEYEIFCGDLSYQITKYN
jgi:hypothetical protein